MYVYYYIYICMYTLSYLHIRILDQLQAALEAASSAIAKSTPRPVPNAALPTTDDWMQRARVASPSYIQESLGDFFTLKKWKNSIDVEN